MFSLIIAIVSIALIVAVVAATMNYSGDIFRPGRATANAAAIIAGAQQVSAAAHMYQSLEGTRATLADLVIKKYLTTYPNVGGGLTLATLNAGTATELVVLTGTTPSDMVCGSINKSAGDADGTVTDIGNLPFACINGAVGTGGVFQFKY